VIQSLIVDRRENAVIRTDQDIKKDVVDQLYWDYRVYASDVQVAVSDGKVALTGSVPTYTARSAATGDAWEIDGVKLVTNLLAVLFPPTFPVPTDKEIEDSAKVTLAWNPDVYSVDIDVSVTGGVVKLEGTVDAYWKRWKAVNLIADLRGVTDIENHLAVVPSESRIDKDIAGDIEAALERNLYIDAEKVTVKVEYGKVRLSGTVPTYYARARAYGAAVNTPGVIDVDNGIVVV
jgi:osmotically-inducible protein OsmY